MSPTQHRITIVVVEDHCVTLEGLVFGLNNEPDIEVVGSASNAEVGLALAKQLNPQVVLLDLYLPGSPGPITMVKLFSQLPESKVVVFSAEDRMACVTAVLEAGAVAHLVKTESIPKIAQIIRKVAAGQAVASSRAANDEVNLTKSEQEILKMLAHGMKYEEIAKLRKSSRGTVRKQCESLLQKLLLDNRERLIAWAVDKGYGTLELDKP
jgi:DNA-binding NarL/FixJ family response regulator